MTDAPADGTRLNAPADGTTMLPDHHQLSDCLYVPIGEALHAELAKHFTQRRVEPGCAICFADEETRAMFIVLEGTASLSETRVAMTSEEGQGTSIGTTEVAEGEAFGHFALAQDTHCFGYSAYGGSEGCTLLELSKAGFVQLLRRDVRRQVDDTVAMLRSRSPFFHGWTPMAMTRLLFRFKPRRYRAGEAVVTQGDEADTAFIITRGACEVHVQEEDGETRTYGNREPGDLVGEIALLTPNATRNATLRAVETESTDACEVRAPPPRPGLLRMGHIRRLHAQVLLIHRRVLLDLDDDTLEGIRRNAAYNKAVTKSVAERTAADIDLLVAKAATLRYVRESRMSDEAVRELCRVCTYMRLYSNACVVARGARVSNLYILLVGQGARPAPRGGGGLRGAQGVGGVRGGGGRCEVGGGCAR